MPVGLVEVPEVDVVELETLDEEDELEEVDEESIAWYKFILKDPPQYSVEFEKQVKLQPVAPFTAFAAKALPQ